MTMPLSEHSAILIMPTDQDPPADAIRTWIRHALNQLPTLTRLRTTLVADELIANARRHGRPPYVLQLTVHRPHTLVVAVDDCSTIDDDESRSELTLVNGLSKRWGVERRRHAKTYWAELMADESIESIVDLSTLHSPPIHGPTTTPVPVQRRRSRPFPTA